MTLTLELSPEREAALKAQAEARGISVQEWLFQLADQLAPPASIAHLQRTNPQEWLRQFRAWAESHDRTTPLLSDEAINRESIYPDRVSDLASRGLMPEASPVVVVESGIPVWKHRPGAITVTSEMVRNLAEDE